MADGAVRERPSPQGGLEDLAEMLYADVRRWAMRWTDTADDAEDVTQLAMMRLITGFDSFRGSSSIVSWMYRVTHNAAISQHRHRSAQRRADERFARDAECVFDEDVFSRLAAQDRVRGMEESSARLSPRRRAAFRMVCLQGFTAREAAQEMGVSPEAVRSHICRAREALGISLAPRSRDRYPLAARPGTGHA